MSRPSADIQGRQEPEVGEIWTQPRGEDASDGQIKNKLNVSSFVYTMRFLLANMAQHLTDDVGRQKSYTV